MTQTTEQDAQPFIMGDVKITDTLTGEVQVYGGLAGEPFSGFWWGDGNAGCDCNRFLFFIRAKLGDALSDEEEDYPCAHGEPRFRVQVYAKGGELLFDDTKDHENPLRAPGP